MEYINLKFKWKEGKFYESSKTAKEGFEKVTYNKIAANGQEQQMTTYHKFYDKVVGTISSVKIDESPFGVNLAVNVRTGNDETTQIKLPLNSKVSYTEEAKAMISSLKDYKTGEEVEIKPVIKTFKRSNGKEGKNISIYINYVNIKNDEGKSESTGYIKFEDVPKWEKKTVRGVDTWNADAEMDFYYAILEDVMKRFDEYWDSKKSNDSGSKKTTTSSKSKGATEAMKPNEEFEVEEFDEDELPF